LLNFVKGKSPIFATQTIVSLYLIMMKQSWWKILSILFLLVPFTAGFLIDVPEPAGVPLQHTIRNLFFHVPMWFGMMILLAVSVVYAILYLLNHKEEYDVYSTAYAKTGVVFGFLGIITGAIWANYQWGQPWSGDAKQNGAAIAMLIYLAYFVLRNSVTQDKQARLGAVYNIFAFCMLFPTIWIMPRLVESLHPGGQGSQGNPALNPKDNTPTMRLIFWIAVVGWTLLGTWITTLRIRIELLHLKHSNAQHD
jgi:heme exporter protein C